MKIFVTGGAGFIGSNLVHSLVELGHTVLNFDKLTYAGNLASLASLEGNDQYRFIRGDLCDAQQVENAVQEFSPDWIMHLAAESHVDRSIDGPGEFIETNITGTFHLLQSARKLYASLASEQKSRFRFLHVSTDEVYGSLGETGLFTEETRYDPHSPYSASKAASDHLARAWYDTYGLPVIVTNCSNNYGPYQFPEKLIPLVILKCLNSEPIPVYGKGENIRDWLYVKDHCRALIAALEKGNIGETYNVGGNNEMRNIDLVRLLCSILDDLEPRNDGKKYSDQITFVADRPGHDLRYAIDATKAARELGWKPLENDSSGFRRTVQWYLANRNWWGDILSQKYKLDRLGTK
jgi:dTDP-glucose 4,6-dehydratase